MTIERSTDSRLGWAADQEGRSKVRVLHIIAALGPTNAQYHEHCLPMLGERRFVLCSLLPSTVDPPPEVALVAGDGSRRGAWKALRSALRQGGHDVIHAHVPVSAALLAAATLLHPRQRRRCVYSMTNSYHSYKRRNRLLLYAIFVAFPHLVLCSEAVRDSLPAALARLGRGRMTVVDNGVNTSQVLAVAADAARSRPRSAGLTVVCASRLVPIKDHLTVLAAFDLMRGPHDRLVFVGDGPLREVLARRIENAGLEGSVELTGLLPRDDVYRSVAHADVFVSMSHGEGLPVAVLEAIACGCPVVLSDIEPHREIARAVPGVPLVALGDARKLAHQLTRLRGMPRDERIALGARGRDVVEERYGVTTMHERLTAVYDQAMTNSR